MPEWFGQDNGIPKGAGEWLKKSVEIILVASISSKLLCCYVNLYFCTKGAIPQNFQRIFLGFTW